MSDMMDDGARRWLFKFAKKNFWRVSAWYDFDDLLQEGHLAYYYTIRRYATAKDPAHRMALFKLVFNSVICNLANQRTRRVPEICFSALFTNDADQSADHLRSTFIDGIAADPDIAEACSVLASAPEPVRQALALFGTEAGCRQLRSGYRKMPSGRHTRRETLNERFCRLTGHDPATTDIVGGIKACLKGG